MATLLPMDVIFSGILTKLPAKSLARFKCVSKSFLAEIPSNIFIKRHHLNAISSEANRLLILPWNNYGTFNIYDLDSPHTPPFVCPYPKQRLMSEMKVVASCECYLLMVYKLYKNDCRGLILLNPITRTYLQLPTLELPDDHNLSSQYSRYGMCHCLDEFNDYYKVVRFRKVKRHYDSEVDYSYMQVFVYGTRTNLWELIEREIIDYEIRSWSEANGILLQKKLIHFLFVYHSWSEEAVSRVRCFDIEGEQWTNDVLLPDYPSNVNPVDLGELDGNLCFWSRSSNVSENSCDLWVMKEYGVKESWVKLISLGISVDFWMSQKEYYQPLAYRKGSQHEILCKRNSSGLLFWYNLEDKEVNKAEFEGVYSFHDSVAYICKGSLLNFPGGQLIENR